MALVFSQKANGSDSRRYSVKVAPIMLVLSVAVISCVGIPGIAGTVPVRTIELSQPSRSGNRVEVLAFTRPIVSYRIMVDSVAPIVAQRIAISITIDDFGAPNTFVVLDSCTGEVLYRVPDEVKCAALSPDGKRVALLKNGSIEVHEIISQRKMLKLQQVNPADDPIFFADGRLILSRMSVPRCGMCLCVSDTSDGRLVRQFGERWGSVDVYALSQDGNFVIAQHRSESSHGRWVLWNVQTGLEIGSIDPDNLERKLSPVQPSTRSPLVLRDLPPIPDSETLPEYKTVDLRSLNGFRIRRSCDGAFLVFPPQHYGLDITERSNKRFALRETGSGVVVKDLPFDIANGYSAFRSFCSCREAKTFLAFSLHRTEFSPYTVKISIWNVSDSRQEYPHVPRIRAERLWSDLGSDVLAAHRASTILRTRPGWTLEFLAARVQPVRSVNPEFLDKLIANLNANDFSVRDRAHRELEAIGERAAGRLRIAMNSEILPSESWRRVQQLLSRLQTHRMVGSTTRRALWSIDVLEEIGTPAAVDLLKVYGNGDLESWVTKEANASIRRIQLKSLGVMDKKESWKW